MLTTILLVRITSRQAGLTESQLEFSRKQTTIYERQADIAERQRQISDRQAEVTEQAFAGLERPYLFVSELSYSCRDAWTERPGYKETRQADPDRVWYDTDVSLKIRNYGKSPAIVRRLEYALMHVLYLPKPQVEKVGTPSRWRDVGVIAADGEFGTNRQSFSIIARDRNEQDTQAQGRNIFLKGTIIYESVLGRRWERTFLLRLDPSGGGITEAGGSERNHEREVTDGPFHDELPGGPHTLMW